MQLSLWDILILAVVQGFTEFLPVSSSGHLVVLSGLIASGDPRELDVADLNVVLHIGTPPSCPAADRRYYPGGSSRLDGESDVRGTD